MIWRISIKKRGNKIIINETDFIAILKELKCNYLATNNEYGYENKYVEELYEQFVYDKCYICNNRVENIQNLQNHCDKCYKYYNLINCEYLQ